MMKVLKATAAIVAFVMPGISAAQDVQILEVPPNTTVNDLLKANDFCPIIVRDGKIYKVCHFNIPPAIEMKIDQLEQQ